LEPLQFLSFLGFLLSFGSTSVCQFVDFCFCFSMESYHHFDSGDAHLPPGFRFHPTDEELITYYLLKKVLDSNFTGRAIAEVDLNKCEPWELPGN